MASPIRRTSPRATSPLALPVLHLGSFSDLQLVGKFGIAADDLDGQDMHEPAFNAQQPYTPTSPSKLSPGIPFLRDSNINRRKTIIMNDHPAPPSRFVPLLDTPPPLPLKDVSTPSPITDHPDYADFAYTRREEGRGLVGTGEGGWRDDWNGTARSYGEQPRRPPVPRIPSAPLASYTSSPAPFAKRPHQQSRSMGAITLTDPSYPAESSSRPQTTYDIGSSRPQTTYDPRYAYDSPAEVPTVPGLLASVRGEAVGSGPYPSDARPKALDVWNADLPRESTRSLGSPSRPLDTPTRADIVPLRIKVPPPAEEICVECLMRDRDLMHIDVTSPRVWSRASDAGFTQLLLIERAFDRQWEAEHGFTAYDGPRQGRHRAALVDEEWDAWEVERRAWVARADEGLRQVVKWRGFTWEEDERREDKGLPVSFRGRFEGGLFEHSLRELARKNVSPSAHRYKTLQKYLRDQALLLGIPPEEEPQLESNIWLRERERFESSYRPANGSTNGKTLAYAPCAREEMPRQRTDSRNGYPVRATMYEASQQVPYGYDAQRYDPTEHLAQEPRRTRVPALQLDVRKGRGISSPGLLELSSQPATRSISRLSPTTSTFRQDQQYNFSADDDASAMDWDPSNGRNSPLRPFSFAVRANKGGASSVRSSPGPRGDRDGKSGVLGRWGDSVTSFFGGSQAGGSHWGGSHGGNSGSMMDMHLGLEADRRHAFLPNPRSVSMASPVRPGFFSRASSFMSHQERPSDMQTPALTPVDTRMSGLARDASQGYPVTTAPPADKKKKGFKGLLQKLKGRKKSEEPPSRTSNPPSRDDDYSTPLAPPPPISFLVQRSDRAANHTRTSSSSSLSAFSGSSSPPMPTSVSSMMMRVSPELPQGARQKMEPRRSSGLSWDE